MTIPGFDLSRPATANAPYLRRLSEESVRLEFSLNLARAAMMHDSEALLRLACLHAIWSGHIPSDAALHDLLDIASLRRSQA